MMRQQLKLTMAVAALVQVQQRVGHPPLHHWQQTLPRPWLLVLQQLRRVVGVLEQSQQQDNEC
jgi:hypothetical protein